MPGVRAGLHVLHPRVPPLDTQLPAQGLGPRRSSERDRWEKGRKENLALIEYDKDDDLTKETEISLPFAKGHKRGQRKETAMTRGDEKALREQNWETGRRKAKRQANAEAEKRDHIASV